jgi:hypothetical protein
VKCSNVGINTPASCDDNKQKEEELETITPEALNFDEKQAKKSGDIKRRICHRMDAWEEGKSDMLAQDTHRTATCRVKK